MRLFFSSLFALMMCLASYAQTVNFTIKMEYDSFVVGEPVVATVKLINKGARPINVSDYGAFKDNRLFFEISRAEYPELYLPKKRPTKLVTNLSLERDEGEALTFTLSEWYDLIATGKYMIKAVLISGNIRYETNLESFEIVPGIELTKISQYIAGKPPIERTLSLVYWNRKGKDVAFLRAIDTRSGLMYRTLLVGNILRVKKPVMEAADEKTFYIFRQVSRDVLMRTVIESTYEGVQLKEQVQAVDVSRAPVIDALRDAVEKRKNR